MTLKEFLGTSADFIVFKLNHKQTSVLGGFVAFWLIVNSSVGIMEHRIYSVVGLLLAFFVMLPISYYNNKEYEKEGE